MFTKPPPPNLNPVAPPAPRGGFRLGAGEVCAPEATHAEHPGATG